MASDPAVFVETRSWLHKASEDVRAAEVARAAEPPLRDAAVFHCQQGAERRAVPRKTIFIKGNHEDFVWLDSQDREEILPGLFYLRNGRAMDLGEGRDSVRVGGIGGCFGPSDYERRSKHLQGYAKRHYTRHEIDEPVGAPGSTSCSCTTHPRA